MTVWSALRQDVARQLERSPTYVEWLTSLLLYRGLQATAMYRVARWCAQHRLGPLAEILTRASQVFYSVDVAHQAEIGPGFVLRHPSDVVVGRGCRIGRNVTIFNGVTLGNRFSGSAARPDGSPVIKDNVFIGTGAKILGPVEVGRDSVIGANAVVTRSVPPGSTVVGNPARVVGRNGEEELPQCGGGHGLEAEVAVLRRRLDDLEKRVQGSAVRDDG